MNQSGTAVVGADQDIEQIDVGYFLAVQQDTAVTSVDWEVFHGWRVGDPEFAGEISVQDRGGAQVACADWTVPTDFAADRCLADLGWLRVDAWSWDWFHRRVAPVTVAPAIPAPPSLPGVALSTVDRRVAAPAIQIRSSAAAPPSVV